MTRHSLSLALIAAVVLATPLGAQRARLAVEPAAPAPGTLVRLALVDSVGPGSAAPADTIVEVCGTMAGEPLHFSRAPLGWRAIGAVPIDSTDSTRIEAIVERASGRADTLHLSIEPPPLPPPSEKLDVAPRFGQPLDSATQARVDSEVARADAIGRRSHDTPRLWREPFTAPRSSTITSRFGKGRVFNGTVSSRHLGVDFRGASGDPVRAANRGVVALVDTTYLGGRVVYVDHGEGIVTAYMHLSKALVAAGDTVARGQRIGLVGATGRVTGPHLHWAARYGALTVNPLGLLELSASPARGRPSSRSPSARSRAPR
ncbi:MAG: M23 family metallopeptidase [Gemmatimonadaceae bacterium]|nr:M23 family metallopeptidase [Gemmatimonadaceae bacterium]